MEFEQLEKLLEPIFQTNGKRERIKILKFGGKSLANGKGLERVLEIIAKRSALGEHFAVVVSARGKATDQLEALLDLAAEGKNFQDRLKLFECYQKEDLPDLDLSQELRAIEKILLGVSLTGDYSLRTKDEVLSHGELIAAKALVGLLGQRGLKAELLDSRELIKTDDSFSHAEVDQRTSKENVILRFHALVPGTIGVMTGFIGSNSDGTTTTLSRNGSNYSAALMANFLDASELVNYTHVDGIFTANPDMVREARLIDTISYGEANELANFGANILHAKTIIPLIEKNIPLRICNTFNDDNDGTLIGPKTEEGGIKSLSVLDNMALINLEGRGLLGKVGVDARIFRALGQSGISVGIVSQGSS